MGVETNLVLYFDYRSMVMTVTRVAILAFDLGLCALSALGFW
jgi:hypothetical protein